MSVALVPEVRPSSMCLQWLTNDGLIGRGGPSQRCKSTSIHSLNHNCNSLLTLQRVADQHEVTQEGVVGDEALNGTVPISIFVQT